jgi:3-hydroxyisobutyrate dehydrogenase-like beta-hydroxyacid dehydrogenase
VDSILIDLLGGELEKIGMIGTGAMGLALLDRLKLAGVRDVTCYDAYGPALESARTLGFTAVASAAQVAKQSTLIDIVVRTDQDMLDCALGPNGVLESAQPGALLLLHSSILPHTVKKVAAAASAKNVHVIDACMTGVPDTVRAGHLSFVVGGAETLIVHEAIQIGIAGGIPYPKALEMMRRIGHDSVLNRWQRTFDPSGNDPLPRSGRNVLNKDIPLVAELARLLDADTPITQQLAAAADRVVAANEKRKKQA